MKNLTISVILLWACLLMNFTSLSQSDTCFTKEEMVQIANIKLDMQKYHRLYTLSEKQLDQFRIALDNY